MTVSQDVETSSVHERLATLAKQVEFLQSQWMKHYPDHPLPVRDIPPSDDRPRAHHPSSTTSSAPVLYETATSVASHAPPSTHGYDRSPTGYDRLPTMNGYDRLTQQAGEPTMNEATRQNQNVWQPLDSFVGPDDPRRAPLPLSVASPSTVVAAPRGVHRVAAGWPTLDASPMPASYTPKRSLQPPSRQPLQQYKTEGDLPELPSIPQPSQPSSEEPPEIGVLDSISQVANQVSPIAGGEEEEDGEGSTIHSTDWHRFLDRIQDAVHDDKEAPSRRPYDDTLLPGDAISNHPPQHYTASQEVPFHPTQEEHFQRSQASYQHSPADDYHAHPSSSFVKEEVTPVGYASPRSASGTPRRTGESTPFRSHPPSTHPYATPRHSPGPSMQFDSSRAPSTIPHHYPSQQQATLRPSPGGEDRFLLTASSTVMTSAGDVTHLANLTMARQHGRSSTPTLMRRMHPPAERKRPPRSFAETPDETQEDDMLSLASAALNERGHRFDTGSSYIQPNDEHYHHSKISNEQHDFRLPSSTPLQQQRPPLYPPPHEEEGQPAFSASSSIAMGAHAHPHYEQPQTPLRAALEDGDGLERIDFASLRTYIPTELELTGMETIPNKRLSVTPYASHMATPQRSTSHAPIGRSPPKEDKPRYDACLPRIEYVSLAETAFEGMTGYDTTHNMTAHFAQKYAIPAAKEEVQTKPKHLPRHLDRAMGKKTLYGEDATTFMYDQFSVHSLAYLKKYGLMRQKEDASPHPSITMGSELESVLLDPHLTSRKPPPVIGRHRETTPRPSVDTLQRGLVPPHIRAPSPRRPPSTEREASDPEADVLNLERIRNLHILC